MKALVLASMVALVATGAVAQTRTRTFDGPNYSGAATITRDQAAGTLTRDAEVTRKADDATASRHYQRQRTGSGYTATGQATGFNGRTLTFDGGGQRTETGFTRSQTVTNDAGRTVFDRHVDVSQPEGVARRDVSVTRAKGFHPRRALNRGRR